MMTENADLKAEILRLEACAVHDTGGEELLRLAALLLQHPDLDPQCAGWTGRLIEKSLNDYYAGKSEEAFNLNKGDPRKSASRRGIDKWTGLSWPAAILLEHDTLPKNRLRGREDIFHRIADRLRPRGYCFNAPTVKTTFYEARKNGRYLRELARFYRRSGFLKSRRLSAK